MRSLCCRIKIKNMEKKKLSLQEINIQSFVTKLEADKKVTIDGAQGLSLDCLTAGSWIVKCCQISAAQPEACLATVSLYSVSVVWDSMLNNCGSVKICFKPPVNGSQGCHTEVLPCSGPKGNCA